MEPVVGIVIGLAVAAAVVLVVHRLRTRGPAGPDIGEAQGDGGIPPDPGASRPAGPGAEEQDPAAAGGETPSKRDDLP